MYVSRLALDHFRSWEHLVVDLAPGVNILQGRNGLGKTNIVEAVEVLSTGASHRATGSLPLVERGQTSATIRANVESDAVAASDDVDDDNENVEIPRVGDPLGESGEPIAEGSDGGRSADDPSVQATGSADPEADPLEAPSPASRVRSNPMGADGRPHPTTTTYELTITARGANRARINGGRSTYLRDVIGRLPSVSFTPEDQRLVAGDPAFRRTLINQAGALLVPGYTERLQTIAKIAKQRAALLKQLGDNRSNPGHGLPSPTEAALNGLEIWTGQFIEAGVALTRDRRRLVDMLAEPFATIYRELAGAGEDVRLAYEPSFDEVLLYPDPQPHISEHFQRIYPGEVARGQNLIGPHRDDLSIDLAGMPAREFASNGEMWTMALALKMALYRVVADARGVRPVVILDDVFAQLDESRRRQILGFAVQQDQVLITVAAAGDIPDMGALTGRPPTIIDVAELKRRQDAYLHPDPSAFGIEVDS